MQGCCSVEWLLRAHQESAHHVPLAGASVPNKAVKHQHWGRFIYSPSHLPGCHHLPGEEGWAPLSPLRAFSKGLRCRSLGPRRTGRRAGVREAAGRNSPGRAMVRAGLQLELCSSQLWVSSQCCTTATHYIMLWNWLFQVLKSDLFFHQTMLLIRGAV